MKNKRGSKNGHIDNTNIGKLQGCHLTHAHSLVNDQDTD